MYLPFKKDLDQLSRFLASRTAPAKEGKLCPILALLIHKMLYIYILCPHSEHQKNPFQSKQSKHFHQRNWFSLM